MTDQNPRPNQPGFRKYGAPVPATKANPPGDDPTVPDGASDRPGRPDSSASKVPTGD